MLENLDSLTPSQRARYEQIRDRPFRRPANIARIEFARARRQSARQIFADYVVANCQGFSCALNQAQLINGTCLKARQIREAAKHFLGKEIGPGLRFRQRRIGVFLLSWVEAVSCTH